MKVTARSVTVEDARAWFPSLRSGFAYLENAGGSQVPRCVADAMRDYMLSAYVQVGAGYPQSRRTTEIVEQSHAFTETMVNAGESGKVVLGPSTTHLAVILANAYATTLKEGDEVIVAETNHEANAGPWHRLAERGVQVRNWAYPCDIESLRGMLSGRTRLVAVTHASNILGETVDVRAIADLAHEVGARVVVDGVAFVPHRSVDVQEIDADYYLFSCYKVYGPHLAAMYGKNEAFAEIVGPNHFFIPPDAVPYKFELGGVSHEACAGWLALREYLAFLAGTDRFDRDAAERAYRTMSSLDHPQIETLLAYLRANPEIRIVGSPDAGPTRLGTVSFLHSRLSSPEVVAAVDQESIGIRYGSMYAWRLCQALGIDPATGVVRVSMLHYNTIEEIERLIAVLKRL